MPHDTRDRGTCHASQDESGVRTSPTVCRVCVVPPCLCAGAVRLHSARMIHDASLDELLQKVWDGGRIDEAEALRLYALPLEELGALADRRRQLLRGSAHAGRGNDI